MDDFGGVARHWLSACLMLFLDHAIHIRQLRQCLFRSRHEGMAARDRRDFCYPAVGLVAVEDDLVIVEVHDPILCQRIAIRLAHYEFLPAFVS